MYAKLFLKVATTGWLLYALAGNILSESQALQKNLFDVLKFIKKQ